MKSKFWYVAAALTLIAGAASAGSIQRHGDRSQILFQEGKHYFEFSVTNVSPSISGTGTGAFAGLQSGDIAPSYQTYHFGYKQEINEKLSFAIVSSNPVGADIEYPLANYPFTLSNATIDAVALTGYLKYQVNDRVSVYGGLRLQSLSGSVDLGVTPPAVYALQVSEDYQLGYVLGGAYEVPEIALRLALTYESKIEHEFKDNTGAPFEVEIPQAVTLHAQTGVTKDTLVFGSARWQEWSEFQVAPPDFVANPLNPFGLPIAFGNGDFWSYEFGVGRKFSKNWSGALVFGYEPGNNNLVGNLEGRDGYTSYGAAVTYTTEAFDVTMGLRYYDLGSATTTTIGSNFSGNDALATGIKVGLRF
jgi:long-subunit fatty acid transport protein